VAKSTIFSNHSLCANELVNLMIAISRPWTTSLSVRCSVLSYRGEELLDRLDRRRGHDGGAHGHGVFVVRNLVQVCRVSAYGRGLAGDLVDVCARRAVCEVESKQDRSM